MSCHGSREPFCNHLVRRGFIHADRADEEHWRRVTVVSRLDVTTNLLLVATLAMRPELTQAIRRAGEAVRRGSRRAWRRWARRAGRRQTSPTACGAWSQ